MVINRKSNGISYDAMIKSKNLNSFFEQEESDENDEITAEEE